MSRIDYVNNYAKMNENSRKLALEIRKSALTRLVWFVAISGYVLLNAKPLWESISGHNFSNVGVFWLSFPWVLSAFFGVVTHIVVDEISLRDDRYFVMKQTALDLHRIKVEDEIEDPNEFILIVKDELPGVKEAKVSVDQFANVGKWLERLTFICIIVAFVWSIFGPLLLI